MFHFWYRSPKGDLLFPGPSAQLSLCSPFAEYAWFIWAWLQIQETGGTQVLVFGSMYQGAVPFTFVEPQT